MRITGGMARGIPLQTPKGDATRPATDALRQAVFSSLSSHIHHSCVLDLFAGSGAYGLDAASRGARTVTFVEQARPALAALRKNLLAVENALQQLEQAPDLTLHQADVFSWCKCADAQWDIVIADPPYPLLEKKASAILNSCSARLKPSHNSRLVLEVPAGFPLTLPPELSLLRRLGKSSKQQPNAWVIGWATSH